MAAISVIIPTKNRPYSLKEAVQSIFDSTFQDFDLYVIDQTKDDSTLAVIAPFCADLRFHYLRNERSRVGAASSRNMGIMASSGAILAIIDDDVTVQPDWLEKIRAEFEADP